MALIGTLSSGVGALKTFTKSLEVIGNNIANVNTTGFKSSSVSFADEFSNTIKASTDSSASQQIGTGVSISGINVKYTQGSLSSTGNTTDLGISGSGYFIVEAAGSDTQYATRNGEFTWDSDGYLVTSDGLRVQGVDGDPAGTYTIGDIQISTDAELTALGVTRQSISIDSSGNVIESYDDGTSATVGQVLLQNFTTPSALMSAGNGLYTSLENASPVSGSLALTIADNAASTNGLGSIESGTLELSNVDLTEQFANMITAQRSFQAASRLVTVSDTILEEITNLKR